MRTAKAGNDEDGYSEALLGIDEEGWFPLRIRVSEVESAVITNGLQDGMVPDTGAEDGQGVTQDTQTNGHASADAQRDASEPSSRSR